MSEKIDEFLMNQAAALSDVRQALAAVQRDTDHNAQRHRETAEALKSMAESLSKLAVVAERMEDMRADVERLRAKVQQPGGLEDQVDTLEARLRTLELWIGGVKFIVSPAVGAILIKEALRLWG